ncbi:unnamed protein product [Malus baccata var. baccata]|uniref:Uncharacterized protein n=1 Tax=Malus domestica TaxID=3750 RepID=A0A498IP10_MALDO|nr:hypothetical protein DVH24_013189 [Malus domestica]
MTFMRQGNHTVHAIPKKYVEMCTPKVCNGNCASSFHPPLCSSAQWKRNPFSGKFDSFHIILRYVQQLVGAILYIKYIVEVINKTR